MGKSGRKWIQKAIKRPGSLKSWLKRHRKEIKHHYGTDPLTKDGKVKVTVLRKLKNDRGFVKELSGSHADTIERKINAAITLDKLRVRDE